MPISVVELFVVVYDKSSITFYQLFADFSEYNSRLVNLTDK